MGWQEKPCKHCAQIHSTNAERNKCYYWRNKGSEQARSKQYKERFAIQRREMVRTARKEPCKDCGARLPWYVMEFDHVRGVKRGTISAMAYQSFARVIEELDKCDVVCANCHRIRTHNRRQQYPNGVFVNTSTTEG